MNTRTYPSLTANPGRLTLSTYPLQFELPTRWSDTENGYRIGPIGLARYCEEARLYILTDLLGNKRLHDGTWRAFLRQLTVEQVSPAAFPDPLTVGGGMRQIGKTSYSFGFAFFQLGTCVGLCDTTDVCVDESGRPAPLREDFRALLQREMLRS